MIVGRHLALALLVCSASVPLFAQSQPAPPAAAPKPAAEPPLRRWVGIQPFMLAPRPPHQTPPVHWWRRIPPAVHDGSEQSLVRRRRLRQRRVTAFPLQSAA